MSDYDFKTLTDKDFEVFCADLLSESQGTRFERFKPGRDAGVDGRYFKGSGEVILQCKHWANTPVSQLVGYLAKSEAPKLQKLRPQRYLIAVSSPLSRNDKTAIFDALTPHMLSAGDVLGKEDLNDLLRAHPVIEQRHYKLWLSSAAVLTHMLNKAIFDRSAATIDDAKDAVATYVVTAHHDLALEKLEKDGVLIITGEPGIGKTTLAEHMCLIHVAKGFQFFKIAEEIREAESVFQPDEDQIFYLDDFLGRNYLDALNGHEGSHIVNFIKRVLRQKNKRFVLTSRSTILNQGRLLIDSFRHQKLDQNEYQLVVRELSDVDRARILYNHIWHSALPLAFVDELYENKRYRVVVDHRNFNPRLIGFVTDSSHAPKNTKEYWPFVERQLENPSEVWDNPFVAQQDDFGRCLVLLVSLHRRPMEESLLAAAYARFVSYPANAAMRGRRDFIASTRHLTGSLLSRRVDGNKASYDLFNPSIGDYVLRRYANDEPTLRLAFCALRASSALATLQQLATNGLVSADDRLSILHSILQEAVDRKFREYPAEYLATVVEDLRIVGIDLTQTERGTLSLVAQFILGQSVPRLFGHCIRLIANCVRVSLVDHQSALRYLTLALEESPGYDELKELDQLLFHLDSNLVDKFNAEHRLEDLVLSAIQEQLREDVQSDDMFGGLAYGDFETAEQRLLDHVADQLGQFYLNFDHDAGRDIVADSDYRSWAEERFEPSLDPREDRIIRPRVAKTAPPAIFDAVDDLFERTKFSARAGE